MPDNRGFPNLGDEVFHKEATEAIGKVEHVFGQRADGAFNVKVGGDDTVVVKATKEAKSENSRLEIVEENSEEIREERKPVPQALKPTEPKPEPEA